MKKLLSLILVLTIIGTVFASFPVNVSAVNVHDVLFDWEFYYKNNSDLQSAFGKNQSKLRNHYNSYGKREGRAPSEFFDPQFYLNKYGDLKNAYGSNYEAAYNHFVNYGINEQRQASKTFSIAIYKNNYADLRNAYGNNHLMYIYHYKTYGKKEGRNAIKAINTPSGNPTDNDTSNVVTNLENGGYYLINYKNTKMGVNVQFSPQTGIGKLVLDSTNDKQSNEVWKFTYNSSYKAYYITPHYRSTAAINALYGAKAKKGSQAVLHDSNVNDTASLWRVEKSGNYYRLKNVASGYYLDVASGKTSAGTKINIWQSDTSTQQFTLTKTDVSSSDNIVTNLENGGYYIINFKNTGMGINVQYEPHTGIGKLVLDSTKDKQSNEVWKFTYNSAHKAYYITPHYRPGAAINAQYGAKAQKGAQAVLHDSNVNDTASLWRVEKSDNYYRFKNIASGFYLDVAYGKTSAGTRINLWSNDASNQQFTLTKVSGPSPNNPTPSEPTQNSTWRYPMNNYYCTWATKTYNSWCQINQNKPKDRNHHIGIDIRSDTDANVYAAASGTVVYKGSTNSNGYHVILSHNLNGTIVKSLYSHLSSYEDCPSEGSQVTQGQKIGVYGKSGLGNVQRGHLHFAVFTGSSTDPWGYASSFTGDKVTYDNCTYYNPNYVIQYNKLP